MLGTIFSTNKQYLGIWVAPDLKGNFLFEGKKKEQNYLTNMFTAS